MFGGLMLLATGASLGLHALSGLGMATYVAGLGFFGLFVRDILAVPRRRNVPTAALHLVGALLWGVLTSIALVVAFSFDEPSLIRNLIVVGGAGGFVFQALLGAWSFLLPSTRPPDPERRRRELIAMELGGRAQVTAYNVGLLAILIGLVGDVGISSAGIVLVWCAASMAIAKTWTFPRLARLPRVVTRSERWWAPPEQTPPEQRSPSI
jgi:hypothetical protein